MRYNIVVSELFALNSFYFLLKYFCFAELFAVSFVNNLDNYLHMTHLPRFNVLFTHDTLIHLPRSNVM